MDRQERLAQRRRLAEERMDRLYAPTYGGDWRTTISPTHHGSSIDSSHCARREHSSGQSDARDTGRPRSSRFGLI